MQPATPTSSDAVEIVPYPAPLPQFSVPIRNVLRSGDKKQLMLLYSEVISEASTFYFQILPSETGKAKISYENIGRTLVEAYTILAVNDNKISRTFLNGKLSSHIRNSRSRIKRKLKPDTPTGTPDQKAKKMCSVKVQTLKLSDDEYNYKLEALNREVAKASPDTEHIKLLLSATYVNRRDWIKHTPSSELRLKDALKAFPAFNQSRFVLYELWLILDDDRMESFKGIIIVFVVPNFCTLIGQRLQHETRKNKIR